MNNSYFCFLSLNFPKSFSEAAPVLDPVQMLLAHAFEGKLIEILSDLFGNIFPLI